MYKVEMAELSIASPQRQLSGVPPGIKAGARRRWFELVLVMLVAFSRSIVGSIYILVSGPGSQKLFSTGSMILGIAEELTGLLMLGYVLSRTQRRFADIGLKWSVRDVGIGLVVAVLAYLSYAAGYRGLYTIHYAIFGSAAAYRPASAFFGHPGAAAVAFILINPFFEELIVRAYLMTEILELTGSTLLAMFLSVALQFSYHLYYGWFIALSLSFQFLVFAGFFAGLRRALPIVVAHGVFDIYALIRLF